jgi:FAD-linked oxidoreductase
VKRRDFLASMAGLAATATMPGCDDRGAAKMPKPPAAAAGPDGKRRLPWTNWSGYQSCLPTERLAPGSVDELVDLMRKAPGPIRPVGSGHSFTPLVPTDGTIVSLRNFSGILSHDAQAVTATLGAGTRLVDVGEALHGIGQAMPNLPDVDVQTLGGAIATGTHGAGEKLGALHAAVIALKLVTPRGDVLECSRAKHPEIFDAARVSLGSLGVITEYTLQNVPAFNVRRTEWLLPVDEYFERYDELAAKHHSFDSYLIPFNDYAFAIAIDPTTEPGPPRPPQEDQGTLSMLRGMRDALGWWDGGRRAVINTFSRTLGGEPQVSVGPSHQMLPSVRNDRFNEMEYHLPRDQLMPTLRKVRDVVESRHGEIFFPIEIRTVKGDEAWLSPFTGHEVSASIAVHHDYREDPLPYFADIEPLYQPVGGRPHWGKMHTLDAATLGQRYPRWQDFLAVRAELDPEGKMLNPFLKKIFGL